MGLIYFARVVQVLGDAMPLVGCPHGHDCDYGRRWAFTLQQVSLDLDRTVAGHPVEGLTLYELTRRAESECDIDVIG